MHLAHIGFILAGSQYPLAVEGEKGNLSVKGFFKLTREESGFPIQMGNLPSLPQNVKDSQIPNPLTLNEMGSLSRILKDDQGGERATVVEERSRG